MSRSNSNLIVRRRLGAPTFFCSSPGRRVVPFPWWIADLHLSVERTAGCASTHEPEDPGGHHGVLLEVVGDRLDGRQTNPRFSLT